MTNFLIFRIDLSLTVEDFKKILSAIESQVKNPLKLKVFSIVSHDFRILKDNSKPNEFLTILESQFGKPLSNRNEKAYTLSEYELRN
ncbi:hypothetical protein NIES593_06000 [Hydrococcus rivularis NIES-593]|uniref:Uncharacterized protein n=1 Tax=Hydrococcus rivularis NIES-593 TaxID=1921803 RepID=A0A1U7HMF0_9CYAN|nr:hypothetical protein [Hydrococcus rivularis]OKH24772.1 hypothetical protein NIES593_06000 [Hydrococcus rivularis NIES-593]